MRRLEGGLMDDGVVIRKVARGDLDRVADVLGRAFADDPVLNFLVKRDDRRQQRIRTIMDVALRKLTYPYGETYVTSGLEGAALWNPPGKRPHGFWVDLRLLPAYVRFSGLRGLSRVSATDRLTEQRHPTAPHFYLQAVGVEPHAQGRGLGTRLLAPVLERCDRERVPAYLETATERNLPLYERLAFRVVDEAPLPGGGPLLRFMWREPR